MRVAMIGTGYVGLVSGACFADFGHHVTCVDTDANKIKALGRGEVPIFEPGLADLIRSNVREGRLAFGMDLAQAVGDADAVFIAVGTPSRRGDGHADLSYVYAAARVFTGWNLQINDPQIHATIVLTPELKNQELVVYQSTGNSYWEGAVSISGQAAGTSVQGEGYVELTGYAK